MFLMSPSSLGGEGNGSPLVFLLENPMDGGAWRAAVHGAAESDTAEATSRRRQQQIGSLKSSAGQDRDVIPTVAMSSRAKLFLILFKSILCKTTDYTAQV